MPHACIVYHGKPDTPDELEADLSAEQRAVTQWRPVAEKFATPGPPPDERQPVVLIADHALSHQFEKLQHEPMRVVIVAADDISMRSLGKRVDVSLANVHDPATRAQLLEIACRLATSRLKNSHLTGQIGRIDDEMNEVGRIATALMQEHDTETLMRLILQIGKRLTESDGAAFLTLEKDENGVPLLRPLVYEFDSLTNIPQSPTITFPVDGTSIMGYAARTKEPVVVADAHALPSNSPFVASEEFRQEYGYWLRSSLVVPMISQHDEVLGVLTFTNRKTDPRAFVKTKEDADRYVIPFEDRHVRLARSLASMAGVSTENARLYSQIEEILESFVKAAVSAIDARDPTTAGHSMRVATLTAALAAAVERTDHGTYRGTHFTPSQMRELRYASLLHDIGKVAVREDVLVKAKKLPPVLWERIDARFDLIRRTLELEHCRLHAERRCATDPASVEEAARLEAVLAEQLKEVDRLHAVIRAANEPNVLAETADVALPDIAKRNFHAANGSDQPYLTPEELRFLQLKRGTLNDRERAEAESHAEKTQQFLSQIPWTDDLRNVVRYASGHHEKLNGSGYPQRLTSKDIPLETRLITLADMFDALTSRDRPYKPAVTPEKALEIMRSEADAGMLDRELVDILAESQAYKVIMGKDWTQL